MNNKLQSLEEIEDIFQKHEFTKYKWIKPEEIVTANWVRMKCLYGCPKAGNCASCPPNTPSVSDCRAFFDEYKDIVVFHIPVELTKPENHNDEMNEINTKLIGMEREVFLSGSVKAFLLFADSCSFCEDCVSSREDCKQPALSRPSPEAFAMDVYSTVRAVGFPIDVLQTYDDTMNRYAFLLVR